MRARVVNLAGASIGIEVTGLSARDQDPSVEETSGRVSKSGSNESAAGVVRRWMASLSESRRAKVERRE